MRAADDQERDEAAGGVHFELWDLKSTCILKRKTVGKPKAKTLVK